MGAVLPATCPSIQCALAKEKHTLKTRRSGCPHSNPGSYFNIAHPGTTFLWSPCDLAAQGINVISEWNFLAKTFETESNKAYRSELLFLGATESHSMIDPRRQPNQECGVGRDGSVVFCSSSGITSLSSNQQSLVIPAPKTRCLWLPLAPAFRWTYPHKDTWF